MKLLALSPDHLHQLTNLLDNAKPEQIWLDAPALAELRATLSGPGFLPRVYVGIEGGLVQGATGNCAMELVAGDYDVEGSALHERRFLRAFQNTVIAAKHVVAVDAEVCDSLLSDALGGSEDEKEGAARGKDGAMSFPNPMLTREDRGYVAWRGRIVEHFGFSDPAEELVAARDLANHCLMLEAKGFPVTDRTCRGRDLYHQAPAGTPWITAMTTYYAIFAGESGRAKRCVLRLQDNAAVAVGMENGQLLLEYGYETEQSYGTTNLFHKLQEEGFWPCDTNNINYEPLIGLFTDIGLTPQLVDAVLATPLPDQPDAEPTHSPA